METQRSRRDIEIATRRRLIVNAARRLLADRDVERVTMDEIAMAVDYTRRTLYSYFSSRDEVLLRVFCEDLAKRWQAQQRAMAEAETGWEKLTAWSQALYAYVREHPHADRLQAYWDYRGIDLEKVGAEVAREFEDLNSTLADGLREVFKLGLTDGSLRNGLEVDLCISQFLYTLRIVIHRALSPAYSFASIDPDSYFNHFLGLLQRAFTPAEGSA